MTNRTFRVYRRSPKVRISIASTLTSLNKNAQGIPALIVLNPVSNLLSCLGLPWGFTTPVFDALLENKHESTLAQKYLLLMI